MTPIAGFFSNRGVATYLVGGFVRDVLMGRPSKDIDISIQGDSFLLGQELSRELGGTFVSLDKKDRTARIVVSLQGEEHWQIDLTALGGTILEDLGRRDFTIDAMAVDLARFPFMRGVQLVDPFGGRADLEKKTVRATGNTVFSDDPGRLLRGVRLAVQLGFSLDPDTQADIKRCASLISQVSPERLRSELCLILSFSGAKSSLHRLDELDLLDRLFPELASCKGVSQPKEHYWDVFGHSLETVGQVERLLSITKDGSPEVDRNIPWDVSLEGYFSQEVAGGNTRTLVLKLAGLLHDIGKPSTKSFEPNGRMRFFGHSEVGAGMAASALERLRFSIKEIKAVQSMVELHLRPGSLSQNGELPTSRAIYRYQRDAGDVAIDTLFLNLADYLAAKGPAIDEVDWKGYAGRIGYILQALIKGQKSERPPKLVDGNDLMSVFGLSPGPGLKVLLEAVREAQAEGLVRTREEALAYLARRVPEPSNPGERH